MVGWDKNATKATNAASRNILMVASYFDFTIFYTSMALILHVIYVVTRTLLPPSHYYYFQIPLHKP
jgi:hypothetical protein